MSFQAWLRSVGGVGYKKGDVDLVDELTGVQTYFDPARELYWDVRRQGPIRGPDGKPIGRRSPSGGLKHAKVDLAWKQSSTGKSKG